MKHMADDKPKPLGGIVADLFCRVNDLFLVYQSLLENTERDRTVSLQTRPASYVKATFLFNAYHYIVLFSGPTFYYRSSHIGQHDSCSRCQIRADDIWRAL